mmetsp:Transcript_5560/g.11539  ORF Transcript_5560/g.11539 Transcript_5560/m.11539 type:complete len:498 (+) Transcript_5560:23-1516(+)
MASTVLRVATLSRLVDGIWINVGTHLPPEGLERMTADSVEVHDWSVQDSSPIHQAWRELLELRRWVATETACGDGQCDLPLKVVRRAGDLQLDVGHGLLGTEKRAEDAAEYFVRGCQLLGDAGEFERCAGVWDTLLPVQAAGDQEILLRELRKAGVARAARDDLDFWQSFAEQQAARDGDAVRCTTSDEALGVRVTPADPLFFQQLRNSADRAGAVGLQQLRDIGTACDELDVSASTPEQILGLVANLSSPALLTFGDGRPDGVVVDSFLEQSPAVIRVFAEPTHARNATISPSSLRMELRTAVNLMKWDVSILPVHLQRVEAPLVLNEDLARAVPVPLPGSVPGFWKHRSRLFLGPLGPDAVGASASSAPRLLHPISNGAEVFLARSAVLQAEQAWTEQWVVNRRSESRPEGVKQSVAFSKVRAVTKETRPIDFDLHRAEWTSHFPDMLSVTPPIRCLAEPGQVVAVPPQWRAQVFGVPLDSCISSFVQHTLDSAA